MAADKPLNPHERLLYLNTGDLGTIFKFSYTIAMLSNEHQGGRALAEVEQLCMSACTCGVVDGITLYPWCMYHLAMLEQITSINLSDNA